MKLTLICVLLSIVILGSSFVNGQQGMYCWDINIYFLYLIDIQVTSGVYFQQLGKKKICYTQHTIFICFVYIQSASYLHLTEALAGDEVAPAAEDLIQEEVVVDIVDDEEGMELNFPKLYIYSGTSKITYKTEF